MTELPDFGTPSCQTSMAAPMPYPLLVALLVALWDQHLAVST
jgi:hypothetical protein